MIKLGFFKMSERVPDLEKGTLSASCYDIKANLIGTQSINRYLEADGTKLSRRVEIGTDGVPYVVIHPHERLQIPTGYIFDIAETDEMLIYPRSGLSLKNGIQLSNSVAVIDSDYVDEVFVCVTNNSMSGSFTIKHGDRIAQIKLQKKEPVELNQLTEKPTVKTDRVGGLGHTGTSTRKRKEAVTVEE